jgi:hypothetical protein
VKRIIHLKYLHSIEQIEPHHVLQTNCRPLVVHTNELNDYLVKYLKGNVSANMLARELIAAEFCKLWDIKFPEYVLITIKDEHLSSELGIGTTKIQMPGFGTLYDNRLKELDRFFEEMNSYQSNKISNPDDFLTIAFFDIWMSNEDRNMGNYNMMIKSAEDGYEFWAIDHGAVFHTGNQDKPNFPISLQDSLLNSPFLFKLFTKKQLFDNQVHEEFRKTWYICATRCKEKYREIINTFPDQWNINKQELTNQLESFMMNYGWFDNCWQTYLEFLERIKNR